MGRIAVAFALAVACLHFTDAVPLPKRAKHHAANVALGSAAAAADLITNLPGLPKGVGFKQYAGMCVRVSERVRDSDTHTYMHTQRERSYVCLHVHVRVPLQVCAMGGGVGRGIMYERHVRQARAEQCPLACRAAVTIVGLCGDCLLLARACSSSAHNQIGLKNATSAVASQHYADFRFSRLAVAEARLYAEFYFAPAPGSCVSRFLNMQATWISGAARKSSIGLSRVSVTLPQILWCVCACLY